MEKLYTIKEVAQYLQVSDRTVNRILKVSDYTIYRIGRQIRIPESTVRAIMVRNRTKEELDETATNLLRN